MIFTETPLKGAYVIDAAPFHDFRGVFMRTYCADEFKKNGIQSQYVQSNLSITESEGTLRGMHYQVEGAEEDKLVRCIKGTILDVIIDLRKGSESFGKYFSLEMTESNGKSIFVPRGFAHGFLTLKGPSYVFYQVSNFYTPGKEKGIRWDDPFFKIPWPIEKPTLSEKDAGYADFKP